MPEETRICQRDLRLHSKEIMDAVERGDTFLVTRDGRGIGQLILLRRRERFVARADFVSSSAVAATVSLERFRSDQDEPFRGTVDDPYAR